MFIINILIIVVFFFAIRAISRMLPESLGRVLMFLVKAFLWIIGFSLLTILIRALSKATI